MICVARTSEERLVDAYLAARNDVVRAGYSDELRWQQSSDFAHLSERGFLRESAWVVLASGMRETVVRKKFPRISAAFQWWRSSKAIVRKRHECKRQALRVFGHVGKIDAILTITSRVNEQGFVELKDRIAREGVDYIRTLPFMGPATSFHLAKNIGMDVAKPDRHLCRVARAAGYESPESICRTISKYVADSVPVIDIVLWRYATLNPDYESLFARA